jgi:hypothetical protein
VKGGEQRHVIPVPKAISCLQDDGSIVTNGAKSFLAKTALIHKHSKRCLMLSLQQQLLVRTARLLTTHMDQTHCRQSYLS